MSLPYGSSFCWCAPRSSLQPPVSDRGTHGRKGDGFGALRAGRTRTSVAVTPKLNSFLSMLLVFFSCCCLVDVSGQCHGWGTKFN